MALPITIPYTFANATSSIPLSNLDTDFTTVANAINGIGNGTVALSNVVITGGSISNVSGLSTSSIANGTSNVSIATANGSVTVATAGTTAMTVSTAQNVGIGTTSPSFRVTANYTAPSTFTNASGDFLQMWQNGGTNALGVAIETTAAVTRFVNNNGYATAFNYAGTAEAMRIDSSGNLLVGTTSLNGGITGITNNLATMTIRNTSATAGKFWKGPYVDPSNIYYIINQNNTGVGMADGATAWSANSDERLKDIIAPITSALEGVQSLRAVRYSWKSDNAKVPHIGLIAQDVQKVLPEVVSSSRLPQSSDETEYLGVAYTEVIPLLVAAIQELSAKNDALETRLAALEAK